MPRRGVAILAAIVLVTGCGRGIVGTPVAGLPAEPWDPCSIPTPAIAATGLDSDLVQSGWVDGVVVDDWLLCVWQGPANNPSYFFRVLFSTKYSLNDVRTNPAYEDFDEIVVGEHNWLKYRSNALPASERCDIAFETTSGVVTTAVEVKGSHTAIDDPCNLVVRHTGDLAQYFPPQP
ncbi:DUF3558 domain-containing protein [Rhodococcoides yunnanense]|uniref:DUF3558 domain-containing protein n=1 Tax=Rhodococcoides yunnanense TaxID=278209 RepID=UPI0009327793|nr:DUF3558 domain-containing protein [Rhodococcus yunnanensis]